LIFQDHFFCGFVFAGKLEIQYGRLSRKSGPVLRLH
jgi:hypothetical protein